MNNPITNDLYLVISKITVLNVYAEHEIEDLHLSTCLSELKNSLTNIVTRLNELESKKDA